MKSLTINNDLKSVIPPLTNEEFSLLEDSIINDGCRDAIIYWSYNGSNIIVDGHNRFAICEKHGIAYKTNELTFNSFDDAKVWIINNQNARRNLTDGWKWELAQVKKELLLRQGEEKRIQTLKKGDKLPDISTIDKTGHNTQKQIASELGWSTGKVAVADIVWREADSIIKDSIKSGEISFNQAFNEIKKATKKADIEKSKDAYVSKFNELIVKPYVSLNNCLDYLKEFNDDSIDVIITDPPYMTDVDDIDKFAYDWVMLALTKIKRSGRFYIFTGAYPKEIKAYLNVFLNQDGFIVDNPLIWTYRNTLGQIPKRKYNLNYQMIWHLYSDSTPLLDTSITKEMFSVQDINAPDGRIGDRLHTWQKPDELADRLIRHGSKDGDLVVDPFCGTGTFLLSAAAHDRIPKGCDASRDNLDIAIKRGCIEDGL
jgi:hypothetical protein